MAASIRVIANNDIVHIAWSFDRALKDCAGFVISRRPAGSSEAWQPLRSLLQFDNRPGAEAEPSTTVAPVAGFHWRDFLDRGSRDTPLQYQVVAVRKKGSGFEPLPAVAPLVSDPVTATEQIGADLEVFFNRGILSTQALSKLLAPYGGSNVDAIQKALDDPNGAARTRLSGELQGALLKLLAERKASGGRCYAALYELTDALLIQQLVDAGSALHLVLSNNTGDKSKGYDNANTAARTALGQSGCELISRYLPDGRSIGHNKFVVLTDGEGQPQAVLTGSTNWTRSGLCTQSNNAVILRSPVIAGVYLDYWKRLREDTLAPGIPPAPKAVSKLQAAALRAADAPAPPFAKLKDGKTEAAVWFSPNTPTLIPDAQRVPGRPATPPDMQTLFNAVAQAKQAVLVLAFMPGQAGNDRSWTLPKQLAAVCRDKPWLFVRGAISDPEAAMEFEASRTPEMDAEFVAPAGILKNEERWLREIYKAGHAIVHNKIVVIDPFSDNCLVVTGSHNLGYKASYNNDENMLFIRGNRQVAEAYATHVADLFEHYRWRWYEQRQAQRAAAADWVRQGAKLETADKVDPRKFYDIAFDPDAPAPDWQARYFDASRLAMRERQFWVGSGRRLDALKPVPGRRVTYGYSAAELKLQRAEAELKARKKAAKEDADSGDGN